MQDVNSIEKVQRQAARFKNMSDKPHEEGCLTKMLNDLELPTSLQQRRKFNKPAFLFKIAWGMVPAINSCDFLASKDQKRWIKAEQSNEYQCSNLGNKNVSYNSKCFVVEK